MIARRIILGTDRQASGGGGTPAVWLAVAVAVSICAVAEVVTPTPVMMTNAAWARFSHDPQQRALAMLLEQIQQAADGYRLTPSPSSSDGRPVGADIQLQFAAMAPRPSGPDERWLTEALACGQERRAEMTRWSNLPPPALLSPLSLLPCHFSVFASVTHG